MPDLTLGPGPAWIDPEAPQCPHHGQMRQDFARDLWTCAGWDGEGCDHTVRNEDLEPRYIGIAGPVTIHFAEPPRITMELQAGPDPGT
jgi:hypothetical protein